MNTKQKLTLGIAAIFMVTLTIVGVTYAYFVTQVSETSTAKVDVTTATFGEITFVKEGDSVLLKAMAGGETASMDYEVKNTGKEALSYDNVLRYTEGLNGAKKFLKPADAETEGENPFNPEEDCYNLADTALATADLKCYAGDDYDNITVVINRYTDSTRSTVEKVVYNGKLSATTPLDIETNVPIAGNAIHYYRITVTHIDAGKNQNLETEAEINVIPDIDSVGGVSNEG